MKNFFIYLHNQTPRGRPIVKPGWQTPREQLSPLNLPFYVRMHAGRGRFIVIIVILAAVLALTLRLPALTASALGFLILLHVRNTQAIEALDQLQVVVLGAPDDVYERETVGVSVTLMNKGKKTIAGVIVEIHFSGALASSGYLIIPHLPPRKKTTVSYLFTADRGMGDYQVGPITLTVTDQIGFGSYAYIHEATHPVKVLPEEIHLSKFQIRRAGRSMYSGVFEVATSGVSPSFMGLREWRTGDSLRYIDWKRSVRSGALLVKEFETSVAVDATIICEDTPFGHSEYHGLSSKESLRDSMIAVSRCLMDQQIRQQLFTSGSTLPPGLGFHHFDSIAKTIAALPFCSKERITDLAARVIDHIPTDSVCILGFASFELDLEALLILLIEFENRRIDFALLIIDSEAFAAAVSSSANVDELQNSITSLLLEHDKAGGRETKRLIGKIIERTYLIGPSETIADVYNETMGI
jgi:uncharacterized protein (DUF58 family)